MSHRAVAVGAALGVIVLSGVLTGFEAFLSPGAQPSIDQLRSIHGLGVIMVFFALLVVAALSSAISLLEHLQCFLCETRGWSRRTACSAARSSAQVAGRNSTARSAAMADSSPIMLDFLQASRAAALERLAAGLEPDPRVPRAPLLLVGA